ncbi:hypothetical protein [Rhodohalobacter sp. 614A]|uniref:hypothetical protein n=1 Tax=Rhodohalobacter sp. 614A TaxID=2908649 RepID=UPI001F1E1075|nr:hypothetical protein [Rhodohalobacter sp. 614A]
MITIPYLASADTVFLQNGPTNRIALTISDSNSESVSAEDLRVARQIGIDMLEVSFPSPFNESVLDDFYLLIDSAEPFRTVYELNENQESVMNSILMGYNAVPGELRDNIAAVKLFDYPADYNDGFPLAAQNITSQLSNSIGEPFFYQSAFLNPEFTSGEIDFISGRLFSSMDPDSVTTSRQSVLLFEPSANVSESLHLLESVLNQSRSHPESIIIIPADWFFSRIEAQPVLSEIVTQYLRGNSVTFPMPADEQETPAINWPIIFLLVIWASFIFHYKYQPMYMATLPRYFLNHSFFVHDIRRKRIRSSTTGMIVLFQHILLTGFFFLLLGDAFISQTGLHSLSTHFPAVFYPGFEKLCLFVLGLLIAFFSHIISIVWLHLMNKNLHQLNQTINLYSWPLHVNLVLVTFVVYFVQLSDAHGWLIVAAAAYFLVWFSSFTIAAIDSAKFLEKYRAFFLFLTVGIHTLLNVIGIALIFWIPYIYEPLEMAFLLP